MSKTASPTKLYYGWIVVAAAFFITFVSVGANNAVGVFVIPMSETFGWSRSLISMAVAINVLMNGLSQPILGLLYDRLGGRKVILTSLVVLGVALSLLTFTSNILFLVVIFGVVMGLAMSGTSFTLLGALVCKWFQKRRATALGISGTGLALGAFILVPLLAFLISIASWRFAWAAVGLFVLVAVVPLSFLLLKDDPKDVGLASDREPGTSGPAGAKAVPADRGPLEGESWRAAFRSAPIWQVSGGFFVCGATTVVMSAHFVPYAMDRGVSPSTGAAIFGILMGLNLPALLAVGFLADKFGRKNLLGGVYILRGLGYAVLLLAPAQVGLWGFAVLAGPTWIATGILTTAIIGEVYGLRHVGVLTGVAFAAHQLGASVSIQLSGVLHDLTGSYALPFSIAALFLIGATLLSFSIQERKYSTRRPAVTAPAT